MKTSTRFACILLFFTTLISDLNAQSKPSSVIVKARAQKDQILIRWAVDHPVYWQKSNKTGFVLYRMLLKQNGQLLENPVKKQIAVLKPLPLEQWMDFIQKDSYGAIIAQAIYGESFDVGSQSQSDVSKIVNMADELNQRHSFALFAAELSFEGAQKAGWGFVDRDVFPNETYAYQVEAVDNPNINPGAFMIGLSDYDELPKVHDFMAIPSDNQAMLSWGIERLKETYCSYMIERSVDGANFETISSTPIVDLNSNAGKTAKQMFFANKLESNDRDYFFRMYGISSFGEKGPYSQVISTRGIPVVKAVPRIVNYVISGSNEVELEWEFPKEEEVNIKGFEIHYAQKDKADFRPTVKGIDKSLRKWKYKGLSNSNYFKIAVLDKQDKKLLSHSTLVQPVDSDPPMKPMGLEGKIDSLGNVILKWKANTEQDLAGYRLLRANTQTEEFVDVFNKMIPGNTANDNVSFAISNKKVYYSVLAEDLRYNRSEFSDVLVLEKPDKLPPTAPVFRDYETSGGNNKLIWINSSCQDVEKHLLKRRLKGETQWIEIASFSKNETEFTDNQTRAGKTYQYLVQAKDHSGLLSSEETSMLTITTLDNSPVSVLRQLESVVDRTNKTINLSWSYDAKYPVSELQIYKNKKGRKPSLWKVVDGKSKTIADSDLEINSDYEYHFLPSLKSSGIVKGEKIEVSY